MSNFERDTKGSIWRKPFALSIVVAATMIGASPAQSDTPVIQFTVEVDSSSIGPIDQAFTQIADAAARGADWNYYELSGLQLMVADAPPSRMYELRCISRVCYVHNSPNQESSRQRLRAGRTLLSGSLIKTEATNPHSISVAAAGASIELISLSGAQQSPMR